MIRNKKGILVLGEPKCGKSIIIEALRGLKIQLKGKIYDLSDNKTSKINHSPRADPFINLTPINDN